MKRNLNIIDEEEAQFFQKIQVSITATVFVVLGLSIFREIFLATLGRETYLGNLRPFELDNENNIGTWFSSLLSSYCALLTFRCCFDSHKRNDFYARRNWFMLGIVLLAMSMEEIVGFHERTTGPLRALLSADGLLYYTWVIPGIVIVVVVALYFIPFVLRFPVRTTLGIIFSGAVYVSGAIGMELLSGLVASDIGTENTYYVWVTIVEEMLEIAGLVSFSWVMFDYMSAGRSDKSLAD